MAAMAISFLLVSLVGIQFVEEVTANPIRPYKEPQVTIFSPSPNEVCNSHTVVLNLSVLMFGYTYNSVERLKWLNCSVHGQPDTQIVLTDLSDGPLGYSWYENGSAVLTGLKDGPHIFYVYGQTTFEHPAYSSVTFTVDTSTPAISNLSVENRTYNNNRVPLSFDVDEPVSQMSYSLDNMSAVVISSNDTVISVPEGSHSIVVYVTDSAGNIGKSDAVFFTVSIPTLTPSLSPSPSPTQQPTLEPTLTPKVDSSSDLVSIIIIAGVGFLAGVIIIAVAVYFKKHKS